MEREEIREKVYDFSCGVVATLIDLVIFSIFYGAEISTAGHSSPKIRQAADDALEGVISLGIDKETIKRAIWKATHRHLIRRPKKGEKFWQITKEGKRRLQNVISKYDEKRIWDDHLYLVTYDIIEKRRKERDILRQFLKKIGCGMLQTSVWLTPYNPRGVLKEFIEERKLSGAVIVSDIGKDGSVGEEDLDDLINRVYKLDQLNERYNEFIYEVRKGRLDKTQIAFKFLSILSNDPQLPFDLLPYNWLGNKAYKLFKRHSFLPK